MKKTVLLLSLAAVLILVSAAALADTHNTLATGECGDNVTWEVWEDADGVRTLEVSGSGPVTESVYPDVYNPFIERIIVHEGITSIEPWTFTTWPLTSVRELSLPTTCTSIGEYSFYSGNLRSLTLSEGLQTLGSRAFFSENGVSHAYCVAVIPVSVTQIGEGALDDLIPAVYPNSPALAYCQQNDIEYILLNSTGSNSHRMALLKAVAQVEDVPLRYRGLAISVLQTMNLTNSQCDSLRTYVLDEEQALKRAMLDNSMTTGEILGFLQRFTAKMNNVGVQISHEIDLINGFPGVHLTATVNGQDASVDVYRTEDHFWTVKNITPSEENGYLYVESEEGATIIGYNGNSTDLVIPASVNGKTVVGISNVNNGFPRGITSLTISEGVKSIGDRAFENCYQLATLNLPDSLENIGERAFQSCSSLTTVTIPGNVSYIGDMAFCDCSALTSVTIQNGVSGIGNRAFENCSALTSIIIPDSVTFIGFGAFGWCSSLTSVFIPNAITRLNECTFYSCSSLKEIFIPKTVTAIDYGVFYECSALTSVLYDGTDAEWSAIQIGEDNDPLLSANRSASSSSSFPESEHPYPNNSNVYQSYNYPGSANYLKIVFSEETEVENGYDFIIINDSENTRQFTGKALSGIPIFVHGNSFVIGLISDEIINAYGYKIESITPATKEEMEMSIYTVTDGVLTRYDGNGGDVVIPSVFNGQTITAIGPNVFENNSSITSITIPDSVTSIGDSAFANCNNLTSVSIPDNVTSIGDFAFSQCGFYDITLPDTITSIGLGAFSYCYNLFYISIPSSVSSIENEVFSNCSSLEMISVEPGNQYFCAEDGVLFNKAKTELICYPAGKKDTRYYIPKSVTSIRCGEWYWDDPSSSAFFCGQGAFAGAQHLERVYIFQGVTKIGIGTFINCSQLNFIWFTSSVSVIDTGAFYDCGRLTYVSFSGSHRQWDSVIINDYNDSLRSAEMAATFPKPRLVLPVNLTAIESEAFIGIPAGTVVFIPDTVTEIAADAFDQEIVILTCNGSYAAQWADDHGLEYNDFLEPDEVMEAIYQNQ